MTTVPGHNQMLQQSGMAKEFSHQAHSPKPSADQAVAHQQAQQVVKNSTVQTSEESERLKQQKKERERRRKAAKAEAEKKQDRDEDVALDSGTTGRLLDTTA